MQIYFNIIRKLVAFLFKAKNKQLKRKHKEVKKVGLCIILSKIESLVVRVKWLIHGLKASVVNDFLSYTPCVLELLSPIYNLKFLDHEYPLE